MSITLFGTCRLNSIPNHNNLNNLLNYTHSTKEVIQLINFLKGDLNIPEPFNKLCFRTGICENRPIEYSEEYSKLFADTDIFIIEICSAKTYIYKNYYLHHLCVDKRFSSYNMTTSIDVLLNHTVKKQSDEEIETDILEIQRLLFPKKIIIVSHYNCIYNGAYIKDRANLINLLESITKKYNIPFVNPTKVLEKYTQNQVLTEDLGHYTELGLQEFSKYIFQYIQEH